MKWPLTFYVDHMPGDAIGDAHGPIVRILASKRDDAGLLAHELRHVKQWAVVGVVLAALMACVCDYLQVDRITQAYASIWMLLFGQPSLYSLVPEFRLQSEVDAYRVQAAHYDDDRRPLFAEFIAHGYRLDVTPSQALEMLRG